MSQTTLSLAAEQAFREAVLLGLVSAASPWPLSLIDPHMQQL